MALWTPADITTALWLDAADSSTLFDATSGGSLVAPNGEVARWEDKSGNARHVTQGTLSLRFTRRVNEKNGLDCLLAGGVDVMNGTFPSSSQLSIFAVASRSTLQDTTILIAVDKYDIASVTPNFQSSDRGSKAIAQYPRDEYGTGTYRVSSATYNASGGSVSGVIWQDGTQKDSQTVTQASSSTNSRVGAFNASGQFGWDGFLSEFVILPRVADSAERQTVEGYLAWKWGQQSNLPSDHMFKNAAPGAGGNTIALRKRLLRMRGYR
jgi:hypothetical protein